MRPLVLLLLPLLAGCDAWPTVVDNQTHSEVSVRYLHKDYDHWSATFPVSAGKAMRLARAHWIQDIDGIRLRDGSRSYFLSGKTLRRLDSACPSNEIARNLSVAGDCYLIYLGQGRIQMTVTAPRALQYEQFGNGS